MNSTAALAAGAAAGAAAVVSAALGATESILLSLVWVPIFEATKRFYLTAPHWLGGCEGRPLEDICANLLGVPSTILFSDLGQRMCQEKVSNKVAGLAIVVVVALGAVLAANFFHLVKSTITMNCNGRRAKSGGVGAHYQLVSWNRFARLRFRYAAHRYATKTAAKILSSFMPMSEKIRTLELIFLPAGHASGDVRHRHRHRQLLLSAPVSDEEEEDDEDIDEDVDDDDDEDDSDEDVDVDEDEDEDAIEDADDDEDEDDDENDDDDDEDDDDEDDDAGAEVVGKVNRARAGATAKQPPPTAASGRGAVRRQSSRRYK